MIHNSRMLAILLPVDIIGVVNNILAVPALVLIDGALAVYILDMNIVVTFEATLHILFASVLLRNLEDIRGTK
jgi:hypothetical protein